MTGWIAAIFMAALWPMYQYFPHHNAVFPGPASVSWTTSLGGKVNGGLALANGTIYGESFDHRVWAVNARTGRLRWSTDAGGIVMTTPIVADGLVIAGTGTSHVRVQTPNRLIWGRPGGDFIVAFDAKTGHVRWRYRTTGENMPSPALVKVRGEQAIVFANGDDHLRALRVRDGRLLWERGIDGIASMSSATVDRGALFVVIGGAAHSKTGDSLIAVNPQSGAILWRAPYGNADCSPTIAAHRVFVQGSASDAHHPAGHNAFNTVYAVDEGTGKRLWSWYSGFGAFARVGSSEEGVAALANAKTLYQAIPATNQFIAFDAATGRIRWKLHTPAAVKMSAVEKNGRLYFGDTGGTWYVVDAASGRVLSKRRFPTYFTVSSPVIWGGTLYVANNDKLYALALGAKQR